VKHKAPDIATEIKRAVLPKNLEGFLFPMFEAISNALHSIEDRYGDELATDGQIKITFEPSKRQIGVSDNGDGFDTKNLNAFLTPFTGNKLTRNGKGFGRFISFKIFDKVFYASPTESADEVGVYKNVIYKYEPLNVEDNLIPLVGEENVTQHPHDSGLTVSFRYPREPFEKFFDFSSEDKIPDYTEESVLTAILDHFLLEFIQGKTPKNFICEIDNVPFNLSDYFDESVVKCGADTVDLEIEGESKTFDLQFMQIDASKSKRHNLYFYADNRATSDLENISGGLKKEAFEDGGGRKYHYLVAVSSDYFVSTQSRDRIANLAVKISRENGKKPLPLKEVLAVSAKSKILEFEPDYTTKRRKIMRKSVEELIAFDPMLRRGLGNQSIDEFIKERGITETKEQLSADLFIIRRRNKFDFGKINSTTPFDELQKVVRDSIPADAKEALAVYVAYRDGVIKVLREMLERKDGTVAKEDAIHELIYPRYKDSEEIDYSSHNLWLIDDDLAYAEYVSSDRTSKGRKREKGEYAHDLLVNSQNELLVVEMKRPQKATFESGDEVKQITNNPVQQLIDQVDQIRVKGGLVTSGNREIEIPKKHMVRGYILTDWNTKLKKYLKNNDFVTTKFGGPMAYRYFRELNMLIEVLAFDRLADRATKRNEVFTEILEGRSNYAGAQQTRLAGE